MTKHKKFLKEACKKMKTSTKDFKKIFEKNRRLYNTYGIISDQWQDLLAEQNGVCAICRQTPDVCGRLCVDHIHQKGFKKMSPEEKKKYVRGLLCYLCNTGLKGFDKTCDGAKNRARLEGTYQYFSKFKLKGE